MKHLILGGGAAGIAAARSIRRFRPQDEIQILSADEGVHSRCMLHHYISGARSAVSLSFLEDGFFENQRIEYRADCPAERIDTAAKTVTAGGAVYHYDKLLIATGAESSIPPVGALRTAPNVYGLRHLADAKRIADRARGTGPVVIIGSGLVGLDAAYALLELGKQVTVVEMAERILPLQLDEDAAAEYQRLFEQHGCRFLLGRRAEDTRCDENGEVSALVLDGGEELPAAMVVVAAGVRAGTAALEGSGIEAERGIKVDGHMRTNMPDVFAAGDVTGLSGIWPNAVKQGEIAGRNMVGIPSLYEDTFALKNTLNFFGLPALSVGATAAEPGDEVVVQRDRHNYRKAILRGGRVVGVQLLGEISNTGFWQYLIKNKVDVAALGKPVFKLSYADFFKTGTRGEFQYSTPPAR